MMTDRARTSRDQLSRPAKFRKSISKHAQKIANGFNELHARIESLGPLLIAVVGLLLLVGVTTNDVLPALVRNAPLQMAIVSTLLIGLPLLAEVFLADTAVPWTVVGLMTVIALCFVIFTAAWSPTAATAPLLSVGQDTQTQFVVTASTTRLQNDEHMYLQIESSNQPCTLPSKPGDRGYGVIGNGNGDQRVLYSASSNGDGTGEAFIKYTFARSLAGDAAWLCVWARTPPRCGWKLGTLCLPGNHPLDSYSFVYLN